ncbi:MAG: T9SS type A sorting domain-containing protein [Bacteroidales bacterium]|nr:T9SS type A sorting domain-containing protein [Bacteroidales bacterium]
MKHLLRTTKRLTNLLTLATLLALPGMGWGANLINENIQSWTVRASYGSWNQAITAGTVNMTRCMVAPAAAATGTCTIGRVQMESSTGIIELPVLASCGTAEFHIVAGGSNRTIKLQSYNGSSWNDLTTFTGIGTTGATYTYNVNSSSPTTLRLASPSAAIYVHDIIITDYASSNDQTSKVEAPTTQIVAGNITSTATTSGGAVDAFKFKISDLGTADGLATKVTAVKIKKSSGTADWTDHIAGASLWDGASQITTGTVVITDSDITFPITSGNLDIVNAGNKEITLKIWLNSTNIVDNSTMIFTISQTSHGFTADATGSGFATDFGASVTGNTMTVRVAATKLLFTTAPSATACPNTNLATPPVVKATDANGMTDADFVSQVTLTNSGSIGMNNYQMDAVAGVANFSSLQFSTTGNVTLTATATGLTSSDPTSSITISVNNATNPAATNGNAQSVLTWTNPSSCYDEIIIVAKEGSAVTSTPTGDGTAYAANLAFGVGTAFDGGYIVYKGTTSSQTVTNLVNGTTYHFTYFTRKGTFWSSGISTTATPVLSTTATDYFRTKTSGNWNATSTWESSVDGSTNWISATLSPTSSANSISILNGHTVTVTSSVTVDQVTIDLGGRINVNSSQTLTIANGVGLDLNIAGTIVNSGAITLQGVTSTIVDGTFTNSGTLTLNTGNTTLIVNGTFNQTVGTAITISSTATTPITFAANSVYNHTANGGTIPTASWNITSNCNITGMVGTVPLGIGQTFGNFTWNCTSQSTYFNINNSAFGVGGTLTVSSTGSSNLALMGSTTTSFTYNFGNINVTGGTLNLNFVSTSSGGSLTLNISGNISVSNSATLNFVAGSGNPSSASYMTLLNLYGNIEVSQNANFSANNAATNSYGLLTFSKSGTQTCNFVSGGTGARGKIDFDIAESSTLQLLENLPISSRNISDYDELTVNGTIDFGIYSVTQGTGSAAKFSAEAGSTLKTANSSGLNGSITVSGSKSLDPSANYIFNATVDQTTGSLLTSAYNIDLQNNNGKVTLSGNIAVSGTLTIPTGSKLDAASYVISGTGDIDLQSGGTFITSHPSGLNGNNTTSGGLSSYSQSANYIYNGTSAQVTGSLLPTTVNNLTLSNSAGVTLTSSTLSVSGTLSNTGGNGGFVIESGGSLLHNSDAVPATFKREIASDNKWHFLSVPINQATMPVILDGNFAPVSGNFDQSNGETYDFYKWSEGTQSEDKNWLNLKNADWSLNTTDFGSTPRFETGKGYLVAYSETFSGSSTKSVAGELSNGSISIPLTAGGNTYNFVGNPYPSSIDWKATSGWSRLMIAEFNGYNVWIWNDAAGQYGAYNSSSVSDEGTNNASRYIAPGQAFFVKAGSAGTLVMTNEVRVHSSQNWLKSDESIPGILRLSVTNSANSYSDEIMIEFGHQDNLGGSEKFYSFYPTAPNFYSIKNGNNLSINLLSDISENQVIPLGLIPGVDASYTIHSNGLETFNKVTLEDKKTGAVTDLKISSAYNFSAVVGDDPNRFLLHFSTVGISTPETTSIQIYTLEGKVYVNGAPANAQFSLTDITGRMVQRVQLGNSGLNTVNVSNLPHGVYVVTVNDGKHLVSHKIIL